MDHDRIQRDALDTVGGKINDRAVARLIGKSGRIDKIAQLGLIVPLRLGAGNALIVALVKHHIPLGDHFVLRLVDRDLVGLHPVKP